MRNNVLGGTRFCSTHSSLISCAEEEEAYIDPLENYLLLPALIEDLNVDMGERNCFNPKSLTSKHFLAS